MIDSIIIQNMRTNETITMDKTGNTGYVISEIDWDEANVTNESYRIPFQIGETLSSTVVGTRVPTITGYVVSDIVPELGTKWNDYFKQQKEDIIEKKDYLNKFISIYNTYKIIAGDYYIEGTPRKALKYSYEENENNEVLCLFEIELGCYYPLFKKINMNEEKYTEIKDNFHFPFFSVSEDSPVWGETYYTTYTIVFGIEERIYSKQINNNGNVEVGMLLKIDVVFDDIKGFTIFNTTTGEKIQIEGDFLNGDVIYINTIQGQEDVYLYREGVYHSSLIGAMVLNDNDFMKLQRGENNITIEVIEGSEGNAQLTISYTEGYFNIKEI